MMASIARDEHVIVEEMLLNLHGLYSNEALHQIRAGWRGADGIMHIRHARDSGDLSATRRDMTHVPDSWPIY